MFVGEFFIIWFVILPWPGDFLLGRLDIMFWISLGVIGSNVASVFVEIISLYS